MRTGSGQSIPRVIPLKNQKCAKGIPLNCGKGLKPRVEHGVTCTSICLVLRNFTVENQLAEFLFLHNASLLCYKKVVALHVHLRLSPDDVCRAIFIPTNHYALSRRRESLLTFISVW